jgi:hypothetical protein
MHCITVSSNIAVSLFVWLIKREHGAWQTLQHCQKSWPAPTRCKLKISWGSVAEEYMKFRVLIGAVQIRQLRHNLLQLRAHMLEKVPYQTHMPGVKFWGWVLLPISGEAEWPIKCQDRTSWCCRNPKYSIKSRRYMGNTMEYGATIFTLKFGISRNIIFLYQITLITYKLIPEDIINKTNKVIALISDITGL